jgi:hypothetical protein
MAAVSFKKLNETKTRRHLNEQNVDDEADLVQHCENLNIICRLCGKVRKGTD